MSLHLTIIMYQVHTNGKIESYSLNERIEYFKSAKMEGIGWRIWSPELFSKSLCKVYLRTPVASQLWLQCPPSILHIIVQSILSLYSSHSRIVTSGQICALLFSTVSQGICFWLPPNHVLNSSTVSYPLIGVRRLFIGPHFYVAFPGQGATLYSLTVCSH